MERLSRVELQARNRARVLTAARDEFAERGFRDAKIDAIAERAGLTRGAVYSNFPGKRALYFAVLAELAEGAAPPAAGPRGGTFAGDGAPPDGGVPGGVLGAGGPARDGAPQAAGAREALAAFARAWVSRLPLATDGPGRIGMDLMPEIMADERIRKPFAQLMKLSGMLLGLALEEVSAGGGRRVRVAEVALTTLHGMSQMADAAPGFVEEFDVVSACERLADLDLGDRWDPPHLPWAAPARPADAPWAPPAAADAL
ncbi:helix-turn-helix domain-containing protein, partial [Microbispora triticiradicis]|uniref:TetR/AcrR family transcriptional regulator n=1 Tax=Microbispora triticiradicis TaxID=2200763 RepID=UPI00296FC51F